MSTRRSKKAPLQNPAANGERGAKPQLQNPQMQNPECKQETWLQKESGMRNLECKTPKANQMQKWDPKCKREQQGQCKTPTAKPQLQNP